MAGAFFELGAGLIEEAGAAIAETVSNPRNVASFLTGQAYEEAKFQTKRAFRDANLGERISYGIVSQDHPSQTSGLGGYRAVAYNPPSPKREKISPQNFSISPQAPVYQAPRTAMSTSRKRQRESTTTYGPQTLAEHIATESVKRVKRAQKRINNNSKEEKFYDRNLTITVGTYTSTVAVTDCLNAPAEGTGDQQHIGAKIQGTRLQIKAIFVPNPTNMGSTSTLLRVVVIRDNTYSTGTAPTLATLFDFPGINVAQNLISGYLKDSLKRYTIITDRYIPLKPYHFNETTTQSYHGRTYFQINVSSWQVAKQYTYTAADAGTGASLESGPIYAFVYTDVGNAGTVYLHSRFYYKDM